MARAGVGGRILSALLHCSLGAAGFFGTAAAIRPLVPLPGEWGLAEKFEYFAERKDDYDVLFLGSSHLWRAVIPEIFDHEMALRGHAVKSFNFGLGGIRAWECDYLAHRLLGLRPAKLKWLVMEGGDWNPGFPERDTIFNSRTVYWHDACQTRKVIAAVWKQEESLLERLRLTADHSQLWLWRVSNYGQARPIIADLRGVSLGTDQGAGSYTTGEGFQTQIVLQHPDFDLEQYEAEVARIPELNAAPVDLDGLYLGALRSIKEVTAAQGVELITLLPPLNEGSPVEWRLHAAGEIDTLFDFNRPQRFPDLFEAKMHFGENHLNLNGARLFTHMLVRAFVLHLRGEEVD